MQRGRAHRHLQGGLCEHNRRVMFHQPQQRAPQHLRAPCTGEGVGGQRRHRDGTRIKRARHAHEHEHEHTRSCFSGAQGPGRGPGGVCGAKPRQCRLPCVAGPDMRRPPTPLRLLRNLSGGAGRATHKLAPPEGPARQRHARKTPKQAVHQGTGPTHVCRGARRTAAQHQQRLRGRAAIVCALCVQRWPREGGIWGAHPSLA